MRNSVKATIDAYDGETHIYVFDPADPVIESYRTLFPALYEDASRMPASLRAHTRYAEELFSVQAEYVSRVSHAESAVVLQQRRRVGTGEILVRPECRAAGR